MASQLLPLVAQMLVGPRRAQSFPVFWRNLRADAATALAQVAPRRHVPRLSRLGHRARDRADARPAGVTKRRLLEWETAAAAAARAAGIVGGRALLRFVADMIGEPDHRAPSSRSLVAIGAPRRAVGGAAVPRCCGSIAPAVAYWLSLPVGPRERPLSDRERLLLRRTARKTWRYFETFVTEADAWLPPDNYQEGDEPRLARRTSPTNIGMRLLSTLAAHDLGYLTTATLIGGSIAR